MNFPACHCTIASVELVAADTEYKYRLPSGCKSFSLRTLDSTKLVAGDDIRFSFMSGYVDTPKLPFEMVESGCVFSQDGLDLEDEYVYFAGVTAGDHVIIVSWS